MMQRPNEAYKSFVDELVRISRVSVTANRIRDWGHSERANDDSDCPLTKLESDRKHFFLELDARQRELLAGLLEEECCSAIHNVASFFEYALFSGGMELRWNGEVVPASPYATMHYDFVCRREGDTWPDEVDQ